MYLFVVTDLLEYTAILRHTNSFIPSTTKRQNLLKIYSIQPFEHNTFKEFCSPFAKKMQEVSAYN